jgi:hypothetical protein
MGIRDGTTAGAEQLSKQLILRKGITASDFCEAVSRRKWEIASFHSQ